MLLNLESFDKIYLYRPFADFRKGILGLSSLVQDEMNLNPFEHYLFIFCNAKKNSIKILYWDDCGFALWHKQLIKEKYKWPYHYLEDSILIEQKIVDQFLIGLNPWQKPFKKLKYKNI